MKNYLFPLLAIVSLCCCQTKSQTIVKYRQLPKLSIEKEVIFPLLDNAVNLFDSIEKKPDSLYFIFNTTKRPENEFYLLQIDSDEYRLKIFDGSSNPIGYFYYKNYLFVVYGKESEQFFSSTNTKKSFRYDPHIKDKLFVIDDSHPYWVYYYHNGKIKLLGNSIPPEYSPQHNDE